MTQRELVDRTRRDYEGAWERLGAGAGMSLMDLPALLEQRRQTCRDVRPRVFNRDRAAMQSFVRTLLGESHWLASACSRVTPLKIPKSKRMPFNPLTIEQAKALAGRLRAHHATTFWLLCLTRMRPEEAFEEHGNSWEVVGDGLVIHGTKSGAAERTVPRVGVLVRAQTTRQAFYVALRAASAKAVSPYDLWRTYAQWIDVARIPAHRQNYCLGHGPKNLDPLYQRTRDATPHLREDAAALLELVDGGVRARMVK